MATIDSRKTIDEMIAANGAVYDDEPPVVKIVEYNNGFDGRRTWGVIWEGEALDRYDHPTEFIRNPKTIWERKA